MNLYKDPDSSKIINVREFYKIKELNLDKKELKSKNKSILRRGKGVVVLSLVILIYFHTSNSTSHKQLDKPYVGRIMWNLEGADWNQKSISCLCYFRHGLGNLIIFFDYFEELLIPKELLHL